MKQYLPIYLLLFIASISLAFYAQRNYDDYSEKNSDDIQKLLDDYYELYNEVKEDGKGEGRTQR